jgi:beta-lactamase regulating signal transducer with metallopeptidase domain
MKSNFTCFSETFDYALGWTVIHSLWQAMAIAILMGIALIVLRKKTAKLRYWVANTALLTVLLAAITTFAYYYDFSKEPPKVQFIPETISQTAGSPVTEIENPKSKILHSTLTLDGFKDYFNQHIPLIVLVWIMGVALFILKLLGGVSYCYYLRSRLNFPADEYWLETLDRLKSKVGVKQSIELVESALTRTPLVVGYMKPMILFPIGAINKLSPTEVEAILAHEIAHVLRKDFIFNILQSVIEALFYYHPAVWVISSAIRNERENCCDDVAIDICGNSMDYAKALVTVQEMAYYPMYQPAMAFAGNRKNQLLFRVQRILNQPQNKTNVMEKLIATCMLVVVMMGLSFGEKSFANNNAHKNNTPPSVSEAILPPTNAESPTPPVSPNEMATFYLYFPEKIDSLKVQEGIENGTYQYEDNTQSAQLTVKNNYIVALKVNNINLNDEQLPNYKRLIDKILRTQQPDQEGRNPIADKAFHDAGITFHDEAMKMQNDKANMSVDKNGFHLNTRDGKGQSFTMSADENGFQMSAIDDDGKPVKMHIDKNGVNIHAKNNATYIKDGIVMNFDENGEKWLVKPEKNGINYIEHFNKQGQLIEKIKAQNDKVYINDREATIEELRQRGWFKNKKGLQKIGGYQNIQSLNEGGDKLNDNKNDNQEDLDKDDLQSQIEELRNDVKELRQEIKECDCTTNFDFRKGLIERLDRLFPAYKAQNQQVFNAFQVRFMEIKNEWERGDCDENKKSTGYINSYGQKNMSISKNNKADSYGTGNSYAEAEMARKNAEKAADKAQKDSEVNDNTESAIHVFFQNLLEADLITSNKSCVVAFNNTQLSIDGKRITGSEFERIKRNFEKALKGKRSFAINLAGKVKQNAPDDLDISGSLSTSYND